MGRLDGKCVLVTGASRGIGAEIARLFAGEGGRVVCAARTLREGEHPLAGSLETTVTGIRATGGTAEAVTANIAEPAECERLVARAREIYGPVDVLVNNAALTYYVQVKDYPINKWMRSWAVNFHAPFMLSQLVLGDMIAQRRGAIVNISSGSAIGPGRGPYPDPASGARGGTCYGAEKAALERFTQGLASEVYQYGIAVSSVAPSQVDGRSARGAAAPHGPGRSPARHGASRQGHGPRHLQSAPPPRVRVDPGCARARRRLARERLLGNLGHGAAMEAPRTVISSARAITGTPVAGSFHGRKTGSDGRRAMASRTIRRLIWASVIVQLLGLAVDALWHGLLHPEFEGTARAEMARHLLRVHLLLYLGVLALLVSTLMALVARARAGRVGIAVPVMVAGALAQTIGEAWHAWSHLEVRPSPIPELLGFLGLAAVVVALFLSRHGGTSAKERGRPREIWRV